MKGEKCSDIIQNWSGNDQWPAVVCGLYCIIVVVTAITSIKKGENEELLPVETEAGKDKVYLAGLTWVRDLKMECHAGVITTNIKLFS